MEKPKYSKGEEMAARIPPMQRVGETDAEYYRRLVEWKQELSLPSKLLLILTVIAFITLTLIVASV